MSRCNLQFSDYQEKTVLNEPKSYDNTPKVLLVDADSLLFLSSYFPENSEMEFNTEELKIKEAKFRLNKKIQEIVNNVEKWYNIKQTLFFIGGSVNFRYKLHPDYKANRKNRKISFLIPILKEYMLNNIQNTVKTEFSEVDDYIFESYKLANKNCLIATIDKDIMYYCPDCPIYDYRSYKSKKLTNAIIEGTFKNFTEKESRLAICTQIICGDPVDFIKGAVGIGKSWCDKNLHINMTNYQFIKSILKAYLKSNKGDSKLAKKDIRLNYSLLKLYTKNEVEKLNLVESK